MRNISLVFLVFLFCLSISALADDDAAPKAYDWGGALTLEAVNNAKGGVEKGTKGLANLDVTLTIDTGAAGWWNNGTWFIYALGNYGKNPSDIIGDLQSVSNISTENSLKVYEFWYEHRFVNDAVKLLVGLQDYNSTFYTLESASLFTSSSFGIGPDTSQVTPSIFPATSTAIHLTLQQDKFYFLLAAYDGVPGDPNNPRGTHVQFDKGDGLFKAAEFGLIDSKQYKFALGGWQKTTEEDGVVDGVPINLNHGFYIIGEKNLSDDLSLFFQYGRADAKKNQLDEYLGGGVRLNNYWREGDALGLGCSIAQNGEPFLRQNPGLESSEALWELTYFMPLVEHLNTQASVYYVENPSMNPELDNALALGLRAYIEF